MTTFYIVRHGETENNINQIIQGCAVDSPLTPKGINQAKSLAKELFLTNFDKVYSSDLARARKTAEILTVDRKLIIKTSKALREQCYGKYEGQSFEVFQSALHEPLVQYDKSNDEKKLHFQLVEGMETDAEASSRFTAYLRKISTDYPDKTILIVSHGDIIRYFLIRIAYATYNQFSDHPIENCGYIKIQSDGTGFRVQETKGINLIS